LESENHLIYGPPASGKTTLASAWAQRAGAEYLSVGEMTRGEISRGTATGKELRSYLNRLLGYPVELIAGIVGDRLASVVRTGKPFILDGFPKYNREVPPFIEMLTKNKLRITSTVIIDLPLEVALERIANRRLCLSCDRQVSVVTPEQISCSFCGESLIERQDDSLMEIGRRYRDHIGALSKTLSLLGEYCGKMVHVDGRQSPDSILAHVLVVTKRLPG